MPVPRLRSRRSSRARPHWVTRSGVPSVLASSTTMISWGTPASTNDRSIRSSSSSTWPASLYVGRTTLRTGCGGGVSSRRTRTSAPSDTDDRLPGPSGDQRNPTSSLQPVARPASARPRRARPRPTLDRVLLVGLLLVVVIGAVFRLVHLGTNLPQVVSPDEPTVMDRALGILHGVTPTQWD